MDTVEWIKHRTCKRKKKLSKARADVTVDEHALRGKTIYYYVCPYCTHYHLTKRSPLKLPKEYIEKECA